MNIVIYNLNSFGGNYEYALQLQAAYLALPGVKSCRIILPVNAPAQSSDKILKLLKADIPSFTNSILKKCYFLYRSIINPFILYRYLKNHPGTIVIFNDFDQLTSFLWAPFFRRLRSTNLLTVILHDPDRDNYLPYRNLSAYTMRQVMKPMEIAFYHGLLPDKPYYRDNSKKVAVPHGVYPPTPPDQVFLQKILAAKGGDHLLGILGNLRDEKNYELVIRALPDLPGLKLLVAGRRSSSAVPVESYLRLITELGLEKRVLWYEQFLSDAELGAAISSCDIISLYYKDSFTSQSGMLNLVAPYRKSIIVSDTKSALTESVRKFRFGKLVPANAPQQFKEAVLDILNEISTKYESAWNDYSEANSWELHVKLAQKEFQEINSGHYAY